MERVDSTFDTIASQLDACNFRTWSSAELNLLISLIEAYYKQVSKSWRQGSSVLPVGPGESLKRVKLCDPSESGHIYGSDGLSRNNKTTAGEDTETHDSQIVTLTVPKEDLPFQTSPSSLSFPSEEQVAEVDRDLTRVRHYLQEKCPFGSLNEPSHKPYPTCVRHAPCQNDPSAVEPIQAKGGNPSRNAPKVLSVSLPEKNIGDANDGVVVASSSFSSWDEKGFASSGGRAEGAVAAPVCVVDAFLYPVGEVEALVAAGRLSREYCQRCGSTAIGLVDYVTHSLAQDPLVYLSCFLVPALVARDGEEHRKDKEVTREKEGRAVTLVDVGSRLGVVLWAMYFAAKAGVYGRGSAPPEDPVGARSVLTRVRGVECDPQFVSLQREVGRRFCARPFLSLDVVESDCFEGEGAIALQSSDFIVLHNVFEYFSESPQGHLRCWKKLRELAWRPGQILICSPSLEETFASFDDVDEDCLSEIMAAALLTSDTLSNGRRTGRKYQDEPENLHSKERKVSKRRRTDLSNEGESPSKAQGEKVNHKWQREWIDSYVERVDVDAIAERFLAFRMKSQSSLHDAESCGEDQGPQSLFNCCTLDHGVEEHRDYSNQLDDASSCPDSIRQELEEQVHNIFVYRVK